MICRYCLSVATINFSNMKIITRFLSILFIGFFVQEELYPQKVVEMLTVPAGNQQTRIVEGGRTILPSGRFLTPAGDLVRITHDPFGLTISPDGRTAVTLHDGVFTIINLNDLSTIRVPSYDGKISSPLSDGSYLGVDFSSDSGTLFLSGGDNGAVIIYDIENMTRLDSISLNGLSGNIMYEDSFTSDLLYNEGENELIVLDRGNFRLVRIDLATRSIKASVRVGRQPFGLAISPDRKTAFVANVGVYEYPLIKGATPENYDSLMIPYHPYGDNTNESIRGTVIEGREIPGVGSPLHPDAMSVFAIDLETNTVTDKFKTGYQVGQMIDDAEIVGGASPNSIAAGSEYAYVSNATNDNISVIDYRNHRITGTIQLHADRRIDRYRGLLPFGLTLSSDEKTLYVALLGFNAVAVVDVGSGDTRGLIPSCWGPVRVGLSPDEKELYIVTCRGLGAGPNGGRDFKVPVQGDYVGDIQLGSFQRVKIPDEKQLAAYTGEVIANTFSEVRTEDDKRNPLPVLPGLHKSPIRHIVYITKENRTYDEVFGQLSNADGDSTLARYGVNCEYTLPELFRVDFPGLRISPNHHKIANQFTFSDNYYCDSDASIHGHHWMMGVIPNEWVEVNSSVTKTAKIFSRAPGRRHPGSTGSMDPEDYAEIGGLWEALDRANVSFYNFGEANETAHTREEWYDTLTGAAHGVMVPMQKALFGRTSHDYAGFNMNIPDQYRENQFEKEFTAKYIEGNEEMPSLVTIQLPNDHGASIRPEDGYLYPQSFMADNDLALGRMLHFLSRTSYWKDMLVIITEDDPQGGVDHVDAHRSILIMAGPYIKKGHVSHTHANFGSVLKTIYNILNVPYVNHFDVTGSLLRDFFTSKPDFTPYTMEMHDARIFDVGKAMEKYHTTIDWRKIGQDRPLDNEEVERAVHYNGR
jgi:DNA-binding beta-propeller fold protein YncE